MKSGYKVPWTEHALNKLKETILYLEKNFSDKEIKRLAEKIESTVELISQNPNLFPYSESKEIFKVVLLRYNNLYYRIKGDCVEIISFFSNCQSPQNRIV